MYTLLAEIHPLMPDYSHSGYIAQETLSVDSICSRCYGTVLSDVLVQIQRWIRYGVSRP